MTDPVNDWLLSKGSDKQDLHGVCAMMNEACRHFGMANPCLNKTISKKMLRGVRNALREGQEITMERFVTLSVSSLETSKKWDINEIAFARSKKFYQSARWKNLRLRALANHQSCRACGRSPKKHGIVLHVDHILPRSIYPEYALYLGNLQILCEDCNIGKGNTIHKRF